MKNLDTKAVWMFFAQFLITLLIPLAVWASGFLYFLLEIDETARMIRTGSKVTGVVLLLCIGAFVWAKLTYHFYRYELSELGFRKESGVIFKKYVTIPYARIQNVDIHRGIIARLLGLSDVFVQTAGASVSVSRGGIGGSGAEGRLPGVSRAEAELLRDELIKRASTSQNHGV